MIRALQNPCVDIITKAGPLQTFLNEFTKFLNLPENKYLVE
jgi:hypothetical protein